MNTLYSVIRALQLASGSNAKQAILQANKDNKLLQEYLKATYDPSISFYQKTAPKPSKAGSCTLSKINIQSIVVMLNGREVTGKAAVEWLRKEMEEFDEESQELISLMIGRSVGASIGDTMILKVWPTLYLIPSYQRCSLMDDKIRAKFEKEGEFLCQEKLDGSYLSLVCDGDELPKAITRAGTHYPQWFANQLAVELANNSVYVGEVEVYATEGSKEVLLDRQTGNGILNSILKGAEEYEYAHLEFRHTCWDWLTPAEFLKGKSDKPYLERLSWLEHCGANVVNTVVVKSLEEAYTFYSSLTAKGMEGAVIKTKNFMWKDGTSKDMVKLKIAFECDLRITAIYEGTGKAKGMLGGITIETSDGLLKCNCGSGFSDSLRKHLWLPENNPVGSVATIIANDIVTKKGSNVSSLFLPIFSELRFDKTEADSLERVEAQLAAAKRNS